jgi:hypothetical protein
MGLPVIGYNVYRASGDRAGAKPILLNPKGTIRATAHLDLTKDTSPAAHTVRAVDRGGLEGAASAEVTVTPLPRLETPVVALHFEDSPNAESGLKGTLVGKAGYASGIVGRALDLRQGGWLAMPHDEAFDVVGDLTLEAWVKFTTLEGMPYEVTGLIDEVKIYQRARSAEEIRQDYQRLVQGRK